MPRANRHAIIDVEDERLTASERNILRQILLRLQSGAQQQPQVSNSAEFEDEMRRVFGELKSRGS